MSDILTRLDRVINNHKQKKTDQSYSAKLLNEGVEKCTEKFGEEAIELIIACLTQKNKEIIHEAADVLYHLNVLMRAKNISIEEVLSELSRREGISGLKEKEDRGTKR